MAAVHKFQRNGLSIHAPVDLDLPLTTIFTESNTTPRSIDDLELSIPTHLSLSHGRTKGMERLCALVAQQSGIEMADVLIMAGASIAIYLVQTALHNPGDHLIITRPNYPSNIDGPKTIGCETSYIDLEFTEAFRVDVDRIAAAIQPNTKLISITNPNNPTGTSMSAEQLHDLAEITRARGCYLLIDETYIDLLHDGQLPRAASLGPHVIGVSTMSKAYGVPGIRVGWITTTNKDLQESFLGAKELISIGVSVLDETVAQQILEKSPELLRSTIADIKNRKDIVNAWVQSEENLEWIPPVAGTIGLVHMKQDPPGGTAAFYDRLLKEQHTLVAQRGWFEQPDTFFRLGFGAPGLENMREGLVAISKALRG